MLVPSRIAAIKNASDTGPVEWPNSSNAMYCLDEAGREWVRKPVNRGELLAEALGWLLSRDLDVPTPDAGITGPPGNRSWLSATIRPAIHWNASRAERLERPQDLGAILAFDALIGNSDRHDANLLFQPSEDGEDVLRVYSIDLANATIGSPELFENIDLCAPPLGSLIADVPRDLVGLGADQFVHRATSVTEEVLAHDVAEACATATIDAFDLMRRSVLRRFRSASDIVAKYLKLLENRP